MPEATRVEPQGAGAEVQRAQAGAADGPAAAPGCGPCGLSRLAAATRGGISDPAAVVRAGEIRGVSRTITDPAVAARMFADELRAGRFVRHINGRPFLVHAWVAEYSGTGDPPPAWVDGHGFLVVDVERVAVP